MAACREMRPPVAAEGPRRPGRARRGARGAAAALLLLAACAASSITAFVSGRPPAAPEPRRAQAARLARVAEEGWYGMPVGVPKVAYRIPGAPNAEWVDIYNRLYRERIIFLGKEIDDSLANQIIGVLLYLDADDSSKPIYLYINSMGGSVLAGLAIYDTLQHIRSPVITINMGMAASMASFLLAAGEKGKRLALPHSRVMMHQAMGGAQGQAEDIKVEAQQIILIQSNMVKAYARMTGKDPETIARDLARDRYMSAEEALEYGIVDEVVKLRDDDELSRWQAAGASSQAPGGGQDAPTAPGGGQNAPAASEPPPPAEGGEDAPETKTV